MSFIHAYNGTFSHKGKKTCDLLQFGWALKTLGIIWGQNNSLEVGH